MHFVQAKSILSAKNGFNLYRGCSHGCIYCDSRSRCYQMQHDFADIEVKANALELLEQALQRKRKPCMLGTGAMTDCYIPLELELQHTRKALELIGHYGFGVTLHTKSNRLLRDLDLLQYIHGKAKCVVQMTLTTLDEQLCKKVEPGVCTTKERVQTLLKLREVGIPTVVWLSPILPFLNDTAENINGILEYCAEAEVYGVICFGMGLTLREGSREYFYQQLDRLFPGLKARYIKTYGRQYELASPRQQELMNLFYRRCQQYNMVCDYRQIFTYLRTLDRPQKQLTLFPDL